jgi:hypothetical protein
MAKKRLTSSAARKKIIDPNALGPGLHGGTIELKSGRTYQVRTIDGQRVPAALADTVDPALADDCLRTGRLVVVMDTPKGPAIAGALQTSLPIAQDRDGVLAVTAKEVRLRADQLALIEVGPVSLSAEASGALRLEGDRLVIDMGALVRVLSARVELP